MKILLKNMEDSKSGEMKKYKETIMKENDKIQIIKENLYMEQEDMHSKSREVYITYIEMSNKHKALDEENNKHKEEIERLIQLHKNTDDKKEQTQQLLEEKECILSEYIELYEIGVKDGQKLDKLRADMDKQIRKLDRENKTKDKKLREMAELKEKLRVNEQKLEEFQDANNKVFADRSTQTNETKYTDIEVQTDMTLNKMNSLERNLNNARSEKDKYMKVVQNIKAKGLSPRKDSKSPHSDNKNDTLEGQFVENEGNFSDLEGMELESQIPTIDLEKVKVEKEVKRQTEFKKKIELDKKQKINKNAYVSLDQYKQKVFKDKEDGTSPKRAGSNSPVRDAAGNIINQDAQNKNEVNSKDQPNWYNSGQNPQFNIFGQPVDGDIFEVSYLLNSVYL